MTRYGSRSICRAVKRRIVQALEDELGVGAAETAAVLAVGDQGFKEGGAFASWAGAVQGISELGQAEQVAGERVVEGAIELGLGRVAGDVDERARRRGDRQAVADAHVLLRIEGAR